MCICGNGVAPPKTGNDNNVPVVREEVCGQIIKLALSNVILVVTWNYNTIWKARPSKISCSCVVTNNNSTFIYCWWFLYCTTVSTTLLTVVPNLRSSTISFPSGESVMSWNISAAPLNEVWYYFNMERAAYLVHVPRHPHRNIGLCYLLHFSYPSVCFGAHRRYPSGLFGQYPTLGN